jgi:ABC-type dipeptide/oligopeptide/nickel transport system ATPase component
MNSNAPYCKSRICVLILKTRQGGVRVLDSIEFDLKSGEAVGIVGESGCGKSMTAFTIMGLVPQPNGRVTDGRIDFEDQDLLSFSEAQMERIRGNKISMIFQEPMTSLNPVFTVGNQILENIRRHQQMSRSRARTVALEMLEAVGIPAAKQRLRAIPP